VLLGHSNGKFSKLDQLLRKNLDGFHMLAGKDRLCAADIRKKKMSQTCDDHNSR